MLSIRITRRAALTSLAGLVLPFATACAAVPTPTPTVSGLVARPGQDEWPEIFWRAPATTQAAYRFAAANRELLRYIPCYCGCGAEGHTSNWDCYIASVSGETVVLDRHGFG